MHLDERLRKEVLPERRSGCCEFAEPHTVAYFGEPHFSSNAGATATCNVCPRNMSRLKSLLSESLCAAVVAQKVQR